MTYEMYLSHHGIKGQKWGVKNGPPYPLEQHSAGKFSGAKDPKELSSWMKKNISYTGYTTLKSPEQTVKRGKGSCHDQVLLELEELQSMGYNPKATFFLEYTPESSQSGTTHSFVTYEQNGKTYWFENSWGGQEGLHEFNNFDEVKKQITKLHKEGKTGDSSRFPNLEFSDFGEHKPGESLQELVDKALATEDEEDKKLKHSEEGDDFKMTDKFIELSEVLASLDPEYIEHHQIKGAKWGVKRGPPYPLQSGIRTKIKKVTQAAKNRVAANRKARAERKEAKEARRKAKNPTLQDRISMMSDEELRQKTERLRLENAYKRELPREQEGESFLRKSASRLNSLKAFGDAVSGLVNTGKALGKAFGLDKFDGDDENPTRRPGESLTDYTRRMAQLASLKKSRDTLGTGAKTDDSSKQKDTEAVKPTSTVKSAPKSSSSFFGFSKDRSNSGKESDTTGKEGLFGPSAEASDWYNGHTSARWGDKTPAATSTSKLPQSFVNSGKNFFEQSFPKKVQDASWSDWTKDDDKKKKGR